MKKYLCKKDFKWDDVIAFKKGEIYKEIKEDIIISKTCGEFVMSGEMFFYFKEIEEGITENLATEAEQFICSKCRVKTSVEFNFSYCPGCGRKVKGMD